MNETPLPTSKNDLLKILGDLNIAFEIHEHDPIFTVEEGAHLEQSIPGMHCRNLFLRDKKKKMFLIVAANETKIDLKKLPALISSKHLSFGSAERLWENLGIRQGSVNPFCIINDKDKNVRIILDKHMMAQERVNYHPMDNGMTMGVSPAGLIQFIKDATSHEPEIIDLTTAAPDI